MDLIDDSQKIKKVRQEIESIKDIMESEAISKAFYEDFAIRFCWSSNALEGNTLTLDDTLDFIETDEVDNGHTYEEYRDTKNHYRAIKKMLFPIGEKEITEEFIMESNSLVIGIDSRYRTKNVFVGSLVEVIYTPPAYENIPNLMKVYVKELGIEESVYEEVIKNVALSHIKFERIHPFRDGNATIRHQIKMT